MPVYCKMRLRKTIITVMVLLFTVSAFSQTKDETLQWLSSHLKIVVMHNQDSILPYTMTKTYTFYEDAFVLKTVKDFYKDPSLNSAPAFSKIWYKDIFTEHDTSIMHSMQQEQQEAMLYTIWAEPVYSIIGREDAPVSFWRTFNEPAGLDLYLPNNKDFGVEAIHQLYHLATLMGAKEKPEELMSEEDVLEE